MSTGQGAVMVVPLIENDQLLLIREFAVGMERLNEKAFHLFLDEWIAILESLPESSRVRWSVDIDPQDMY